MVGPSWSYIWCENETLNGCIEIVTFKWGTFLHQLGSLQLDQKSWATATKGELLYSPDASLHTTEISKQLWWHQIKGRCRVRRHLLLSLPLIKFQLISIPGPMRFQEQRYEVCLGLWHLCQPDSASAAADHLLPCPVWVSFCGKLDTSVHIPVRTTLSRCSDVLLLLLWELHNIRPADKFDSALHSSSSALNTQRTADKEREMHNAESVQQPRLKREAFLWGV